MNTKKRLTLILTAVIGSSLASPALAKDGVVAQTQQILAVLCKASALFDMPSTACDVEKAVAAAAKAADSVKSAVASVRKNTVPQALQSALQPILGEDSGKLDAVRDTIASTLGSGDIGDLQSGIDQISQQIDSLFSDKAAKTAAALGSGKSQSPTASTEANGAAGQISGNGATQGLAQVTLAEQAKNAKEFVATAANGEAAQRIAQTLSEDTSAVELLTTAQKAARQSVQRAQTAVSSRAALQVVGEQLGFMMEQSASHNLLLMQFLANQAQISALSAQQLTTIANQETQRLNGEAAAASASFDGAISVAKEYPNNIGEFFDGWNKTLAFVGDPTPPNLGNPVP